MKLNKIVQMDISFYQNERTCISCVFHVFFDRAFLEKVKFFIYPSKYNEKKIRVK